MPKLSDLLLVSDVDGTFLKDLTTISDRDIEAIRRFQSKGGRFTIASGRSHLQSGRIFEAFDIDIPSIHSNGSYIYDVRSDQLLYSHFMPEHAARVLKEVCSSAAVHAAIVFTMEGAYTVYYDGSPLTTKGLDPNNYGSRPIDEVTSPWTKVMCIIDQDTMFETEAACKQLSHSLGVDDLSFVATQGLFLEVGTLGVNKGTALQRLAKLVEVPIENTVAIGDYTNDLEMIQIAGFSACPQNAKDTVAAAAKMIVGPCGTALSDLIEYLEQKYE